MTNEEKNAYNKEYYATHKEEIKASRKAYYTAHKEERNAYMKAYRDAHKEEAKAWRDAHKEEHKAYNKLYMKAYYQTFNGRIVKMCNNNNRHDKQKGFDISNNITFEQALALIESHDCHYCGENDKMQLGLDRIDNSKPHTPDNVIVCCQKCNVERNNRYSVDEYKQRKQSA